MHKSPSSYIWPRSYSLCSWQSQMLHFPETSDLPLRFYNVSEKLDSFFWNLTPERSDINNHKNRHFSCGFWKCVCIEIAELRHFHTKLGSPSIGKLILRIISCTLCTLGRQTTFSSLQHKHELEWEIFSSTSQGFLQLEIGISVIWHMHLKYPSGLENAQSAWALHAGEETANRYKIRSVKSGKDKEREWMDDWISLHKKQGHEVKLAGGQRHKYGILQTTHS